MGEWSEYFQPPAFLDASRMMIMNEDMRELVVGYAGIRSDMDVLDVGCGCGAFAFYLAAGTDGVRYCGLDDDERFVREARKRALADESANEFAFVEGDALALPYSDDSFDRVVSHTFLTSVPDFRGALAEMKRVCRPGGAVVSMTAMTFFNQTMFPGVYPSSYSYRARLHVLTEKAWQLYEATAPLSSFTAGVDPAFLPRAFVEAGFVSIAAYPVGKFFSLSNAAMADESKRAYIELSYEAECEKFKTHYAKDENGVFSSEEAREYLKLLGRKRDMLLSDVGENEIWEWMGDANLLVVGSVQA